MPLETIYFRLEIIAFLINLGTFFLLRKLCLANGKGSVHALLYVLLFFTAPTLLSLWGATIIFPNVSQLVLFMFSTLFIGTVTLRSCCILVLRWKLDFWAFIPMHQSIYPKDWTGFFFIAFVITSLQIWAYNIPF